MTAVTSRPYATSSLDLFSDELLTDPYPAYSELREQAAAVWLEANQVWALTRYHAIRDTLADWETFSSNGLAFNDQMNEALAGTTLTTDPPDHGPLRAALTENLSPRALRKMKVGIDEKADRIVATLVDHGSFDAVDDLSRALPLQVVADLIGLQGEVRGEVLRWGEAAFNVLGPMNQRTMDAFPVAGELFQWCEQVEAEDLTEGSIGRAIFAAADRGEIPADSPGQIIHQYIAAGMESTIASIANAIQLLATHPDQFDIVREDPSLALSAFTEVLRLEAPIHAFRRTVTREVEIDGTLIRAGEHVAVLYGAGNRDPRHYEDPERFDVRRNPIDHLSFGYGTHTCAGQGLARFEASAVIAALARRVRRFEVGETHRQLNNMTRALTTLPILSVEPA